MEKKTKAIIAIIIAVLCVSAAVYAVVERENDTKMANDGGNAIEFYPTDGTTMVLGTYKGAIPIGEHFAGWSLTENPAIGQTPDYLAGKTITLTSDNSPLTLYAVFDYNAYTIAFDGNGSSDTMGSMTDVSYGLSVNLTTCAMTYVGHTFAGWNTEADGTGTGYADGASVSGLTAVDGATVTLYAQWTANHYTITYNAGAGTGESFTQSVTYGESVTLSGAAFTMNHYHQSGWSDNYILGQTFVYSIAGNLNLTAVYTPTATA